MKLLVISIIFMTISLSASAEDVISYYKYNKLYDEYSEQFDLRKKYYDLYGEQFDLRKKYYKLYDEQFEKRENALKENSKLIETNNRLCRKVGGNARSLYQEVSGRANTISADINSVENQSKDTATAEIALQLMVLNARIEVDKNKLNILSNELKIFKSECNSDGINNDFIYEVEQKVATSGKYMGKLDESILQVLKKKIK